jgi:hypothetical protein
MDPQAVLAEARARGIDIGTQLAVHGYYEAWSVGDAAVLRFPRTWSRADAIARGDGPLFGELVADVVPEVLLGLPQPRAAAAFFASAIERTRGVTCRVLAPLVDRIELAGVVAALHERPAGRSLAAMDQNEIRSKLPAIAGALVELHDTFGNHGDLRPQHVYVDGDRVTFTDPFPSDPPGIAIGTAGYSLPFLAKTPGDVRDERLLVRDLGAFACIAAEAHGAPLGWERYLVRLTGAWQHKHFNNGFPMRAQIDETTAALAAIADADARGWIANAAAVVLQSFETGGAIPAGTARRHLEGLASAPAGDTLAAFRTDIAKIAQRAYEQPSLLQFLVAERTNRRGNPEVSRAFEQRDEALARLPPIVDDVRARYVAAFGEPAIVTPPPVAHPKPIWAETHELRTMLLDLEKLLDPSWYNATTLGEVGGLLARISSTIAKLREAGFYMALRRYTHVVL